MAGQEPFTNTSETYLGTKIDRPGRYDLQPTVMYNANGTNKKFRMWWLGQYASPAPDLAPSTLAPEDRIYFSYSADGTTWSPPKVVLKGNGGIGGSRMDDHLVGSPSVLQVNNVYYMFYEAYVSTTAVNRYWNATGADTWCTNGRPRQVYSGDFPCGAGGQALDWDGTYVYEKNLGFAPAYQRAGTHPVYEGEKVYLTLGNKVNRFLSLSPIVASCSATEKVRPLSAGKPAFWLYDNPAAGRTALYAAFRPDSSNSFATTASNLEGGVPDVPPVLGYICTSIDSANIRGTNLNRIFLATSSDGETWTRFNGPYEGGAIIDPINNRRLRFNHDCAPDAKEVHDFQRWYGAGFPSALVRDGILEVFYHDDTADDSKCGPRGLPAYRIRLPLDGIASPQAYIDAMSTRRKQRGAFGHDIKYSNYHKRYFVLGITESGGTNCCESFTQFPRLMWSSKYPDPDNFPNIHADNTIAAPENPFPAQRLEGYGAIAGDFLGNTLDFPEATSPYTAFHLFCEAEPHLPNPAYCANPDVHCVSPFNRELDHVLLFGFFPPNEAPVLASIGDQSVQVGATLSFNISASDSDNDRLTYEISTPPPGATFDPTQRRFTWIPTSDQIGEYVVTFSVKDDVVPQGQDSEVITIFVSGSEGEGEGEGEGEAQTQTADQDGNSIVSLPELLRVIQFYNSPALHCADNPNDTEDGYVPGTGANQSCAPHDTDYNPQDWKINLSELLRVIQFYNSLGYHYCPAENTEDGFCPDLA